MNCMGNVCRHDDGLAFLKDEGFLVDDDLALTLQHLHHCIERGTVLAEPLSLIEGKKGDVARTFYQDLLADDAIG